MSEGTLALLIDAWRTKRKGATAIEHQRQMRLAEMVEYARSNSLYFRHLYRDLSVNVREPSLLPVTNKKELMAHFDEWVTDRSINLEEARDFVNDPRRIGAYYRNQYTLLTTSGTTGTPGIFVWDPRTMRVVPATAFRMLASWLSPMDLLRIIMRGGRMSMVMGSGGHFASAIAAARLTKRRGRSVQTLSVHHPLSKLVAMLNQHRPAITAPYASTAMLLASEQEAGRLQINPVLMVLSAEGLPQAEYGRVAKVFHAIVGNTYAATECPFLSYSCAYGWQHVNSDWVIVEAVDRNYEPVPPGTQSHTVLITNLANRVQPILRYDIGDGVVERADRCPCGKPFPAIRVRGRTSELLVFTNDRGERVSLPPLALELDVQGIDLIQIIQISDTELAVRFRQAQGTDRREAWETLYQALNHLLSQHGLGNVTITQSAELPEQSQGGKYRLIIAQRDASSAAEKSEMTNQSNTSKLWK